MRYDVWFNFDCPQVAEIRALNGDTIETVDWFYIPAGCLADSPSRPGDWHILRTKRLRALFAQRGWHLAGAGPYLWAEKL